MMSIDAKRRRVGRKAANVGIVGIAQNLTARDAAKPCSQALEAACPL